VLAELLAHLRRLQGQLARGHENQGLDLRAARVHLFQNGDAKGRGFARAVFRAREHVAPRQGNGDGFFLNRGGFFKALLVDAHEELALEEVVLEVVALGVGHVLLVC
jgi:hypothetical protein